jgi:hypothetical protein
LLAVILVVGKPQDALFGVVLVTSALIGIGQKLRAKRTLDRLAALSAPRVRMIRDGTQRDIAVADLVPPSARLPTTRTATRRSPPSGTPSRRTGTGLLEALGDDARTTTACWMPARSAWPSPT